MLLLSGDQMAPSASVVMLVRRCGLPMVPCSSFQGASQICEVPSFAEIKRTCLPSGETRPLLSPAAPVVIFFSATLPSMETVHRCVVFLLAARSTSVTENMTHLPLGETCGSAMRLIA